MRLHLQIAGSRKPMVSNVSHNFPFFFFFFFFFENNSNKNWSGNGSLSDSVNYSCRKPSRGLINRQSWKTPARRGCRGPRPVSRCNRVSLHKRWRGKVKYKYMCNRGSYWKFFSINGAPLERVRVRNFGYGKRCVRPAGHVTGNARESESTK